MIEPNPKFTSFQKMEYDLGQKLGVAMTFKVGRYNYRNAVSTSLFGVRPHQIPFIVALSRAELIRAFWRKLGAM